MLALLTKKFKSYVGRSSSPVSCLNALMFGGKKVKRTHCCVSVLISLKY